MDLRCDHKKHGEFLDGVFEVKCSSRFCAQAGVVVIHRWDALTGERLQDKRFADPVGRGAARRQEGAKL